jgi:uncharacterized membrane-anchored protein
LSRAWGALVEAADRALAWVAGHRRAVLVATAVFQAGVLLAMVAKFSMPLMASGGRTVLLHVVPVDPRDLLRGHYVTLSYDASRMWPMGITRHDGIGKTVYVTIAPDKDGRHYHAVGAALTPPDPDSNPLFLRGTATEAGIRFGLESFYVQEGKGQAYEDAARRGELWAEVTVAPGGSSALRRLVIE